MSESKVGFRGYIQRHVSNFRLTPAQAQELRRVTRDLIDCGAQLETGRAVTSAPQVFQWMLEESARERNGVVEVEAPPLAPVVGWLRGLERLTDR